MVNWLKNELERVKKDLDLAHEENQLLNLENQRLKELEQSHKKLNGELRLQLVQEIEKVKKEADNLMMNKIIKYEKKIRRLKNEARTMLNFP
jgi:regulator of replication initiation timing